MTAIERIQAALQGLGLKAVEARLEGLPEQAAKKEPSYADFLDELPRCEVEARRSRYLRARLQLAHLPFVKNFDQFEFGFQPSIDERQIRELRTLRFIHEASNVIFLGLSGVGKTHLSVALAEAAIQAGFGAYFMTAHELVHDLGRAYRECRLGRRIRVGPRLPRFAEFALRLLCFGLKLRDTLAPLRAGRRTVIQRKKRHGNSPEI